MRAGIVLLISVVAETTLRADPLREARAARLTTLVDQLGAPSYATRDAASRSLAAIGEWALPVLRERGAAAPDLETRRRTDEIVRRILRHCGRSPTSGAVLVLIEPGIFMMGSPERERGRRPDELIHEVRLDRPFLLGKYEVTQAEFAALMQFNPSHFSPRGHGKEKVAGRDTARFPVDTVSWFDAVEFCNRLSERDGFPPYYQLSEIRREGESIVAARAEILGGNGYCLPTEAQWEYACRAGAASLFHFGHTNSGKDANTRPGQAIGYGSGPDWQALGRTEAVGSYPPNLWGLYDMHGNVAEWCRDWYDRDYYETSPKVNPTGSVLGQHRVLRGGSYMVAESSCRSASRAFHPPGGSYSYTGFRLARNP